MRRRAALLALAMAAFCPAVAPGEPPLLRLSLRDTVLPDVRLCQYGEEETIREARAFMVGSTSVLPLFGPRGLELTWTDEGANRSVPLSEARTLQTLEIRVSGRTSKLLAYRDHFGRLHRGNPAAKTATVAGRTLVFIDRDFDGVHLEEDVDAFGLLEARHVVPLKHDFVLGSCRYRLHRIGPGKSEATLSSSPLGTRLTPAVQKILEALNDERLFHGLLTVDLDEEISLRYGQPHADWMARNGLCEHEQSAGTAGATPEGAIAGRSCILSPPNPQGPVTSWFDTPVHGYQIAAPDFTRTAVAERAGFSLLWVFDGQHGMSWPPSGARFPAVFPPHEAIDVPTSWWDEIGDVREGDPDTDWGYPIRVYQGPGALGNHSEYPEEVKVTLRAEGASQEEPVQIVAGPGDVPSGGPGRSGWVKFLVLPRRPLARLTVYRLGMSWLLDGRPFHWQSTFRTGSARGQFRPPRSLK